MTTPSNTDLREAIEKIFFKYRSTKHIRENNSNYWPLFTDLIDLFQAREQQIFSELNRNLDKLASELNYQNPDNQKVAKHIFAKVRSRLVQNKTNDGGRNEG